MAEEKNNQELKIYKHSKLFVILIIIMVVAICLQGIYIFNLSRQLKEAEFFLSPSTCKILKNKQLKSFGICPKMQQTAQSIIPPGPAFVSPGLLFRKLQNRLNSQLSNDPFYYNKPQNPGTINSTSPSMAISQHTDKYLLKFIIPGIDKKNISIKLRNDILTVSGTNQQNNQSNKISQSSYNEFTQSISIPSDVDTSKITSDCKNGILTITLPKTSDQKTAKEVIIN